MENCEEKEVMNTHIQIQNIAQTSRHDDKIELIRTTITIMCFVLSFHLHLLPFNRFASLLKNFNQICVCVMCV